MYIVAQLAGPLGVVLAVVGAMSHNHGLVVLGVALVAHFSLDTGLLFPILRARLGRQRRSEPSSNQRYFSLLRYSSLSTHLVM